MFAGSGVEGSGAGGSSNEGSSCCSEGIMSVGAVSGGGGRGAGDSGSACSGDEGSGDGGLGIDVEEAAWDGVSARGSGSSTAGGDCCIWCNGGVGEHGDGDLAEGMGWRIGGEMSRD